MDRRNILPDNLRIVSGGDIIVEEDDAIVHFIGWEEDSPNGRSGFTIVVNSCGQQHMFSATRTYKEE